MMIDQAFTTTPPGRVALVGLGVMGHPMAGHLARAGHAVTVFNRTTAKAEAWAAEYGGRMAPSPADAARNADLVFTCVGNDEDLRAVVLGDGGAMAGMAPGRIGMAPHTSCWSHWI